MPIFMVIFGELIDSMGSATTSDSKGFTELPDKSLFMIYIAAAMFIVATGNHIAFQVFSENIQHRIKIVYFKACLEKDASWFD